MSIDPPTCAFQTFSESHNPPMPAEFCENDAVDGGEFCLDHADLDYGPDPDAARDRILDDSWEV